MNMKRLSRQTCRFLQPPGVISCAAVAGRLEGAGPLGGHFDAVAEDSFCGRKTWEQGEAQMQADALRLALQKGGLTAEDVDCVFAGDLLNQNIGATFALRDFHIPFYGVYGACSTMGETLALAATAIAGGSGCGCSAAVLNGYLLEGMRQGRWRRLLFAPTGALLSPTSSFQGESIPGICHAVVFSRTKEDA